MLPYGCMFQCLMVRDRNTAHDVIKTIYINVFLIALLLKFHWRIPFVFVHFPRQQQLAHIPRYCWGTLVPLTDSPLAPSSRSTRPHRSCWQPGAHTANSPALSKTIIEEAPHNGRAPINKERGRLKRQSMQDSQWGRPGLCRRLGWGFNWRPRGPSHLTAGNLRHRVRGGGGVETLGGLNEL